ncbi:MAG: DUF11 domain-containing protein [Actinomycetia bacterium]|nr:DUF11 domain-containing protein [Actinomycetes bacterium]
MNDVATTSRSRVARSVLAMALLVFGLPLATLIPASGVVEADPAANAANVSQSTTGALAGGSVPDGTCRAHITATGGGGASGGLAAANGGRGGAAATIDATVAVLPGQAYSGSVAGGGQTNSTGGVGGGGTGGTIVNLHRGAGGGGRSVVAIGGLTQVVAGGGGGGGAAHNAGTPLPGNGGAAGTAVGAGTAGVGATGTNGVDNPAGNVVGAGQGGQAAAGGAGGTNSAAGTFEDGQAGGGTATGVGGNGGPDANYDSAGGGGAGYTGGGGGASTVGDTVTGAGGGGGSSWVAATSPVAAANVPTGIAGVNTAQTAQSANGANGSVTIDWIPCQYDLVMTKTVSPTTINAGDRATWTVSITNNGPDAMTRGDTISLADTLPTGPNAATPGPSFNVTSISTSGGSNANLLSGAVTCTGLSVGSSMPASTVCTRPYAPAVGTPGTPPAASGTRGLNVGETLTIVYQQVISNTAPCATITNTATSTDRPTLTGTTDVVGVPTLNTVSTPLVINCYDLAVAKTVSPTPFVQLGGTITWTITVTNNGPGSMNGPIATVANPLVVTDVFPSTNLSAATLTGSTGPAGACTLVVSTVTCATGLPASGQQVLTFTQTVSGSAVDSAVVANTATVSDPKTGDSNDSSSASTIVHHPRITLNKTIVSRVNPADQFTVRVVNGVTTVGTATTAGAGLTASTGVVLAAGGTYTLSEVMAAGSASTIGQYTNFISCTNSNATSTTVLPSGAGTSFTVSPTGLDNITCTFTNTPRPALITVSNTTIGGVGPFNYGLTNLSSPSTSITTTVAGTPTNSPQFTATAVNSAVSIAETVPSGWAFTSVSCTDANSAVTGNVGTFGTLVGSTVTIPAANVKAGSNITCAFVNTKQARLTITKTGVGGGGAFDYTTTGGLSPSTFTLNPAPPVSDSRVFTSVAPGTYTVTEAALAGFHLADITCSNLPGSAPGTTNTTTIGSGLLSVTLVPGADYQCTYTNIANANVAIIKSTVGGDETFTFTTTGTGIGPDPTPSITTAGGTGSAAFDVAFDVANPTRNLTITEDPLPAGWILTAIACTDGVGAPVGTPDLPTRSVAFTAAPGQDVSCRFTNEKLPVVTAIRKVSIGGTGTFNFAGGTNGLPANLALDTGAANPASSGPYTLTAFNTPTSITETIPTNYTLTSAVCVDGSSSPVATTLVGGVLTIDPSEVVGGVEFTCTFTNTRKSAQVSVVKRWINGEVGNQVTISSTGGTNNPGLVSVADTTNESDLGTPVTVYAGETLTLSETFNTGSPANYSSVLTCVNASDVTPTNGLSIAAADDGANIVCTYTNTGLADVYAAKTGGAVVGPDASGAYQVSYSVVVANGGIAPTTYGPLVDTPNFAPNLTISGAVWTTSGPGAPAGGSSSGSGPYTLAAAASTIGAGTIHTFNVTVTFKFATYTPAAACAGPGTGLHNSINLASGDATANDNTACVPPPAPPAPSIDIVKSALPSSVTAAGQLVTYSFVVTNNGNVTLTSVGVTDPLVGLSVVSCPVSTLAPAAATTCTATYTVTQSDVDAGSIANTATAHGTPPVGAPVTDDGSATVPATADPSITIVKSALPTTVTAAGQTVNYSFLLTNTGNVTLHAVGVTDPLPGLSVVSCPATTLAPAATTTCTASYTVTLADMDAGSIANTATVSGTPPTGPAVTDSDSATVTATNSPAISVVKSALPTTVTAAGQTVNYSFLVTNIGNVTLTSVGVTDPLPGLSVVSCPVSTLAPSISTTCTASYTVTLANMNAGSIVNTATASGIPPGGAPDDAVTDTDTATVTATRTPSITVVKSALPTVVTAAGQTVNYSFLVTNTGNVTLTSVAVTDPLPGLSVVSCPVSTLAPAATTTCTASYTVTLADMNAGSIVNTATTSGTPPSGPPVTDTDTATVTATRTPSILVVKSASPTTVTAAGQTVNYSFLVTNTGNVTLTSVGVTDPLPGLSVVSCPVSTLAPAATTTCTATYTVTQANVNAGSIVNTATVSGTPPSGPPVTDTDTATVTATRTPSILVVKSALPTTVSAAGQTVNYSFLVTNTGNVTLTSVGVTDPLPGLSVVSCPVSTLAPAATTTCTASYTTTLADMNAGSIVNTATTSGTPPSGPPVTDTDTATVTATRTPSITVVKAAAPTTVTAAGQTVNYSFLVTNTGNVTLTSVGVADPLPGLSVVSCPVSTLAPAATTTCTATYTVTQANMNAGSIVNTATTSGTPPSGPPVTDTDTATVTATRTPSITVVKAALPTTVTAAGQTVNYSFLVTNTGNVTLTSVAVTDPLPGLSVVSCPVSTLAPAATTTCTATYTVTQANVNAGSIVNTATVAGTPPSGAPVTDTDTATVTATRTPSITVVKSALPTTVTAAGQTVNYSFLVTNTGNVTLTSVVVTDPLPGLSVVSCPVSTLAPAATTTCTASYAVTQADVNAGTIVNTATVSGTPPSGPPVTDTGSTTVTAPRTPSITVAKSAAPTTVTAAGQTVNYSFLVTNTGNVTLTSVDVTDPLPGLSVVSCPVSTLAPAATTTCTASYTVTQADVNAGTILNTATATGTPPSGPAVTDTDTATVTATQTPSITVLKSALPTTVTAAGQVVTYSFLVTNTGNVTLTSVAVVDPLPGLSVVSCPVSTLAPAATTTCTATYTVTQADVNAGSIVNTATVSGDPPSGPPVTNTGSTTVTAPSSPGITVVKSTTEPPYTAVGQVLDFTLTATNTGNVTLTNVTITDAMAVIGSCTPAAPATLLPGQTLVCAAAHAVTQADLDHGSFDNVGAVSGVTPQAATVTDDSNVVTIPATKSPAVTLSKATTSTSFNAVGQQVPYTITALNSGNVTLTNVVITDPNAAIGTCTPAAPATLAPGQSMSCAAVHTVTQADLTALSITNTAHVAADAGVLDVSGSSNVVLVPGTPTIPRTGGDIAGSLKLVGMFLVSGLLLLVASKRRRQCYLVLPPLR